MDLTTALSRAAEWESNPRIRPTPETARQVASVLAAEIRRLTAPAPAAHDPAELDGLSEAQVEFMDQVVNGRKTMIHYLRERAAVRITRNRELPEAPPWALEIADNSEFWLGCFDTPLAASMQASRLGLPMVTG